MRNSMGHTASSGIVNHVQARLRGKIVDHMVCTFGADRVLSAL